VNSDKDYYRILGVLDDAEDIVIKAAYRALAQRYHPDKWQGDPAEATRRMSEINSAYAVLSDPVKRSVYDAQRDKSQFKEEPPESEDANQSINKDWDIATKYYPDLRVAEKTLHTISPALAFTFRLTLIENKSFSNWVSVAKELEGHFFGKYFGNNPEVHAFAKELILEGRKDAAKELNEAVRVLGNVDAEVIERIAREFKTSRARERAGTSKKEPPNASTENRGSDRSNSGSTGGALAALPLSFSEAICTCLRKYATFDGYASRSEFWWFLLAEVLVFIVLEIAGIPQWWPLVFWLLFLPTTAVTVRRLHDINLSGWYYLCLWIPIIGFLMLYLLSKPSETSGNMGGKGEADSGQGNGICPNCRGGVMLTDKQCGKCKADFTGIDGWRPQPRSQK